MGNDDVTMRVAAHRGEPYLVVSADAHAGPSVARHLRNYCPPKYRREYDEFVGALDRDQHTAPTDRDDTLVGGNAHVKLTQMSRQDPNAPEWLKAAWARSRECAGLQDPDARRADMDADGVAVDVIFAGGDNGETLPFAGIGIDAGSPDVSPELKSVGGHIWNAWLADFVSGAPERHLGVMQIPIWDVSAAVKEIEWAHEAGLKAVNFPAPRRDYRPYTDPMYEPLWAACAERRLPLVTHSGGGEPALGLDGPLGRAVSAAEIHWLSRRGLWQLIFGGAFERHPGLKLVFTEQRVTWVPETLRDLDSIYLSQAHREVAATLPRRPSEYWRDHCFLSGSFLAPFEAEARHEVGLANLMWGSDYPHQEGTWPRTRLAMRNALAGIPEDEVRMILGENALEVYDIDQSLVRPIAARIGPTPAELDTRVAVEELPEFVGAAFRRIGTYA
ncbi:MAG TPA: amidohydrolase family protein [Ilumatobacteraceae bacterium]|jgi:predicted TIM-barrel fold metal-dependent hydrolase